MSTLISVIIPVYNVESYLEECLKSVIEQTYQNIEIICVDNNSTDGSRLILNDYAKKDNRIVVLECKKQGLSATRNKGIDACRGEYIIFVDSDDYIEKDCVELLYNAIINLNTDMVISFAKYYNQVKKKFENNKDYFFYQESFSKDFQDVIPTDVILENYDKVKVFVWANIYKASIIKDKKLRFAEGLSYEDSLFNVSYFLVSKHVGFLIAYTYVYRLSRRGSITSSTNKYVNDTIKVFKITKDLLVEYGIFNKSEGAFSRLYIKTIAMVSRKKINVSYKFFVAISQELKKINPKYIEDKKMLLLRDSAFKYYFRYKIINLVFLIALYRNLKNKLLLTYFPSKNLSKQ